MEQQSAEQGLERKRITRKRKGIQPEYWKEYCERLYEDDATSHEEINPRSNMLDIMQSEVKGAIRGLSKNKAVGLITCQLKR